MARLIHELEVHQIELEMQNEELRASRERVEAGLALYADLYDRAPTGYLTLDRAGVIQRVNLMGAQMLGAERSRLVKRRFDRWVAPGDRNIFGDFLRRVFASETNPDCEVALSVDGLPPLVVHVEGVRSAAEAECLVGLVDISERKRAEVALRESEVRFRTLADSGQALIWTSGLDKKCDYFNQPWLDFTGRTLAQDLGDGWVEGVHPDDLDRCVAIYTGSFDRRERFSMEYRLRRADGTYGWIRDDGAPRFNQAGEFLGYIGHCLDLTQRKQAEAALQETNAYLDNLFNHANAPIIVWDPQFKITRFNHAFEALTGRPASEVTGQVLELLFPPEQVARSMAEIHKTLVGERWETVEIAIQHRDGTVRTLLWNSATLLAADGKTPVATIAQGQDITGRKQAEEALQQLNAELEQRVQERTAEALDLYQTAPCGYHSIGPDGTVLQMNDTELGWLGYAREEVEGRRRLVDLMAPASAALFEERFREFREESGRAAWEWEMRSKAGSSVFLLVYSQAVQDAAGQFLRSQSAALNITERKRVEMALSESEEKSRSIVETAPMAMYFYHLEATGRLVLTGANPAADRIIGIAHQDLVGRSIEEAFPNLAQTEIPEMYRSVALEKIGAQQFEIPYRDDRFAGYYTVNVFRTGERTIAVSFLDISERRQAEVALEESEQNLRSFFDTIDYFCFILDLQGNMLRFNQTVLRRLGYTEEELIGQSVLVTHPPDRRAEAGSIVAAMLAGTRNFCPVPLMAKDGTLIPVETRVMPGTWQGQPALFGVSKDISELRASEEKFSLIFHANPSPMALSSIPDGRYLEVNAAFERVTGHARATVIGLTPAGLGVLADAAQAEKLAQILAGQTPFTDLECCLRTKSGAIVYGLLGGDILPLQNTRVWLTVLIDITERVQAEVQLRKLQSAVEQSPTVVLITDPNGTIEYVNPQFSIQTGYTAAEAVGRNPRFLQSGSHSREFYRELWRTLRSGQTWRGEFCNRRKDGALFYESTAIAPIRDSPGQITHFVAIKEDVTKLRYMTDQLRLARDAAESANRAKSTFLANMSHEIRTPMNAILGFAQLLQRDPLITGQQRQRLDTINRSGEHLIRLINDILDMAKIESGLMNLALADCDFNALLEDVEGMFRLRVEEKQLQFELQRASGVPQRLHTDAGRVRQVLVNILSNAVKFTAQGNIRLRVTSELLPKPSAESAAARLGIEVSDTGLGIAPEELGLVFEAFEQTHSGRRSGGGTGLGMAISRQLARKLGGDLTVTSQVGVGSTFRFTFVAEVRDPASGTGVVTGVPNRVIGFRIEGPPPQALVVDDTESNRHVLRDLLEMVGLVVHEAVDGTEALERCAVLRPALVLMDRRMPGLDGLATIRALRSSPVGRDLRIMIVSADTLGMEEREWQSAGADGFISKPFHNEDLLTQLGRLLGLELVHAAPVAPVVPRLELNAADLARLSPSVRAGLLEATEVGDADRLQELIGQHVVPHQPALGAALRQLAANYDYQTLSQALQPPSAP
jgi:PAS domain S-box-containing protein